MTKPIVDWERLWFPAGTSLPNGFLPEEPSLYGLMGRPLRELETLSCLVLLGIPGMGKTTEMQIAKGRALSRGERWHFVNLGRTVSLEQLDNELRQTEPGVVHNIVLDGLDEALSRMLQLETHIPELLRGLLTANPQA